MITKYDNLTVYDGSNPHFHMYRKHGKFPSNLTLGFENEIVFSPGDVPYKFHHKVSDFMLQNPYLYLKDECSCCGVELNSYPFNYNWFLALMKNSKKENFISELSNLKHPTNFYVNNTCGFHIHLGKKFFSKKHLIKMVKFFYNKKNTKFLHKISKRTKTSFNEWSSPFIPIKDGKTPYTFKELVSFSRRKFWDEMVDKASILNLYPQNTIEIRMFHGTINPKLFKAYLEFALAVSLFTRDTNYDEVTVKNFKKYVKKNIKTYKNLDRLITRPRSLKV